MKVKGSGIEEGLTRVGNRDSGMQGGASLERPSLSVAGWVHLFFENKPTKLLKTQDSVAKRDKTIPNPDSLAMTRAKGSLRLLSPGVS